jgi:hypothetical protein
VCNPYSPEYVNLTVVNEIEAVSVTDLIFYWQVLYVVQSHHQSSLRLEVHKAETLFPFSVA